MHGQAANKSRQESIGKWKKKGERRMKNERRKNGSRRIY
jgi:hypothetical protein